MPLMQHVHGPWAIDQPTRTWPLHSKAATRDAETAALALQTRPHDLMARAGLAVARLALALAPHTRYAWVAAGPGNNGGDGLVAAVHLRRAGWHVCVQLVGNAATRPADAAWALQQAQDAGVPISSGQSPAHPTGAAGWGFVIDALLGIGSTRATSGDVAASIDAINAGTAPVLAVDVPSGLDADTGDCWGAPAVRASATLSLLTLKPGIFTALGRDHAGRVWLDTLGMGMDMDMDMGMDMNRNRNRKTGAPTALLHVPAPRLPRLHASNKGSHGDVAVVAGAAGMTGAAWLAARAALAAGGGRVFVSLLDNGPEVVDLLHPELMQRRRWWLSPPALLARHTVVCGCGGGDAVAEAMPPLLAYAARLVLDADALNAVARDGALAQQLRSRAKRALQTVLTPHPLEAGRLLNLSAAQVQNDRLGAAQALADAMQCTVLLKGSGSVVAAPGALPLLNPTGNAALAGPGTGDVLAGWLAGRWAQQVSRPPQQVAADATWEHGHAADRFSGAARGLPLRASELINHLGG